MISTRSAVNSASRKELIGKVRGFLIRLQLEIGSNFSFQDVLNLLQENPTLVGNYSPSRLAAATISMARCATTLADLDPINL